MVTTRAGPIPVSAGSRPLPVERRMPLLTLTVRAPFAWEAPMRADDARGEPDRHLARLELSAEREHLFAALAFLRSETSRLGLGAAETSVLLPELFRGEPPRSGALGAVTLRATCWAWSACGTAPVPLPRCSSCAPHPARRPTDRAYSDAPRTDRWSRMLSGVEQARAGLQEDWGSTPSCTGGLRRRHEARTVLPDTQWRGVQAQPARRSPAEPRRTHRWAEWRAQTDCRRKWGRGAGHRASDRNRSSRKRTVLRTLRPNIRRPTRRNAGSADAEGSARALKIRI